MRNKNKPHLVFRNGLWVCGAPVVAWLGRYRNHGFGNTPKAAYDAHKFREAIVETTTK